ncbi:inactive poly [ADP-ribose] polymerase RCD1-like isoform X2 [Carex rostrata]
MNSAFPRNRSNFKRKRECSTINNRQLVKRYENFLTSGSPQRVLFYEKKQWTDFPPQTVILASGDFKNKKSVTETAFRGQQLLLDFVHCVCVDQETGFKKPIAWIDENEKHYFPEITPEICDEIVGTNYDPKGQPEIDSMSSAESSNSDPGCGKDEEVVSSGKKKKVEHVIDFGVIKSKLLRGLGPLFNERDVIKILQLPVSDKSGHIRAEAFEQEVEKVKNLRGDANVRYAWLASKQDAVLEIFSGGSLQIAQSVKCPSYGIGAHLVPENCSYTCASYADMEEDGLIRMILCRVIMGNMEPLVLNSKQFQPTNDTFDGGVDNLQSPNYYVIWDTDLEKRILPEYVVTIKVPEKAKEWMSVKENNLHNTSVTNSGSPRSVLEERKFYPGMGLNGGETNRNDKRGSAMPSSQWMPFAMLFASISTKASPHAMDCINAHYEDYKRKKISRVELVRWLRHIVGDGVLYSTIKQLQHKLPPMPSNGARGNQVNGSLNTGIVDPTL